MSDTSKNRASGNAGEPKKATEAKKAAGAKATQAKKTTSAKNAGTERKTSTGAEKANAAEPRARKVTSNAEDKLKATSAKRTASKPAAKTTVARPKAERASQESPESHDHAPERTVAVTRRTARGTTNNKLLVVMAVMFVAFLGAYNFAARGSTAGAAGVPSADGTIAAGGAAAAGGGCGMSGGASGGGGGGGCCGGGGAPVEGATTVAGEVQTIDVDTSQGSFSPNIIKAKAGVPIEMNFSQAPGGCLSGVLFPDFNIQEDLTGGPKTVKLPALEPGEYTFYCQMQMVSATLVVE